METIAHQVWINATPQIVYDAITNKTGLSHWWLDSNAMPEVGFVIEFLIVGHLHNKIKIIYLQPHRHVEWECIDDIGEWKGTHLNFEILAKNDAVILNFKHTGWTEASDFFTICNFHWARHLLMLKALCETGTNQINTETEAEWAKLAQKLMG